MLYEKYRKKVIKFADILKTIKRFRILIISLLAAALCIIAAFFAVCGIVYDVVECPSQLTYGQSVSYRANAVFRSVYYEYRAEGSDEWSEEQPVTAGSYQVRAVSSNIFGGKRYGEAYAFVIEPKSINVAIDQTSVKYGVDPSVTAELEYGDTIECTSFIYDDITAQSTSVLPDKSGIKITDSHGNDVTASYKINPVGGIIDFVKRDIDVIVSDGSAVYDGNRFESSEYELSSETPLAEGDELYAVFDDNITDAGEVENLPEIKIYRNTDDGKVEVTGNYNINIQAGILTVEKRPLYITSSDAEKVYNGQALSCADSEDYQLSEDSSLVEGHTITVSDYAEITGVGQTENLLSFIIKDGDGNDVTSNYSVFLEAGTLTVAARPVVVQTSEGGWVYDGATHGSDKFEVVTEGELVSGYAEYGFISGHSVSVAEQTSITDVGSVENALGLAVADGDGNDVTSNYSITYINGALTVTARPVTVVTSDGKWMYDGEAHSQKGHYVSDDGEYGLVEGHTTVVSDSAAIKDVSVIDNVLVVGISAGDRDVTANYDISYIYGTLTVTARPATVKADDASKVYDGTPLTCGTITFISAIRIADVYAETCGSQTDAGTSSNTVVEGSLKITDADGNDITGNFAVTYEAGTLTVERRPVILHYSGGEWVYDGQPHSNTEIVLTEDSPYGFVEGHQPVVDTFTTITDVGSTQNILTVRIFAEDNTEVTSNYSISYISDALTVTARPITIKAGDATKVYDGTPLTCELYEITSGLSLVDGHTLYAETNGSQTAVGSSTNSISEEIVKITAPDGKDVTSNYEITFEDGTLTVTARPVTVITADGEWIYDGEAHSKTDYEVSSESLYGFVEWQKTVVETCASITDVGTAANELELKVYDGEEDVTANYEISCICGTLTVTARPVTIKLDDVSRVYDGEPFTSTQYSVVSELGIVAGQTLYFEVNGRQTDVGTSSNSVIKDTLNVTDAEGKDVTANYEITCKDGTLTVTARPVTIKLDDVSRIYDGEPFTSTQYIIVSELGIVAGHTLYFEADGSQTDVGTSPNSVIKDSIKITAADGKDVTANYEITCEDGTLTVIARPITIKAGDATKDYDGTPLTCELYEVTSELRLVEGHTLYAETYGSQTEIGKGVNYVDLDSVKITDGDRDVTRNYYVCDSEGQLIVMIPGELVVTTGSAEKVYDATPLTNSEYTATSTLGAGFENLEFTYTVNCTGYIVNAGSVSNTAEIKVYSADGQDMTAFAHIDVVYGKLEVIPRPIIVVTESYQWKYDGLPHSWEECFIKPGEYNGQYYDLVSGHDYSADDFAVIIDVGSKENSCTVTIFIEGAPDGENDVTDNYSITYEFGTLTIVEESEGGSGEDGSGGDGSGGGSGEGGSGEGGSGEGGSSEDGSGEASDLDTSGIIAGGGSGGSGDAVTFRVYSDASGTFYFRLMSFGDYSGKSWSKAQDYGLLLDGKYGYNYLTGMALGSAGVGSAYMSIQMLTSDYLLPYYMAAEREGTEPDYTVQTSDVWYKGDVSSIYSFYCYVYDYVTDGAVTVSLDGYLTQAERAYRDYVYANYLNVPDGTRSYLDELIRQNGFSVTNSDIIAEVAAYIQNAATYNLDYDKGLDKEDDIVVAFLSKYHEGICQHYASAATLLYRALGIPARYSIGYVGTTSAGSWTEVGPNTAHAWVEVYIDGMGWVKVEVTGAGGSGSGGSGTIDEQKIELMLKPEDKIKTYDGLPLVADSFEGADNESRLLLRELVAEGYTYEVEYSGSITEVGKTESYISSFKLYAPDGSEVKALDLTLIPGSLEVVGCPIITIHPYILQKYYDGKVLEYNADDYYVTGLPDGWSLLFSLEGVSLTDAGVLTTNTLKNLPIEVYNGDTRLIEGTDFVVEFAGKDVLSVDRRPITISTVSDSKKYDGSPLANGYYWISSGSLAEGHEITVEVTGAITDIGKTENTIGKIVITDKDGNDVTENYNIEKSLGELQILPD